MDRLKTILKLREEGKTLQFIGDKFNITRERVRQIEAKHFGYLTPLQLLRKEEIQKRKKERAKWKEEQLKKIGIKIDNVKNSIGYLTGMSDSSKFGSRDRIRELIRIRDKHTCQICGKVWEIGKRRFDVHHIVGNSNDTFKCDRNYDNQITLCHKCHLNLDSWKMLKNI